MPIVRFDGFSHCVATRVTSAAVIVR